MPQCGERAAHSQPAMVHFSACYRTRVLTFDVLFLSLDIQRPFWTLNIFTRFDRCRLFSVVTSVDNDTPCCFCCLCHVDLIKIFPESLQQKHLMCCVCVETLITTLILPVWLNKSSNISPVSVKITFWELTCFISSVHWCILTWKNLDKRRWCRRCFYVCVARKSTGLNIWD